MSQKYEALAKQIVDKVGGNKNINSVTNCQTRLRFVLKDDEVADKEAIKDLDGVVGVVESGGQFQVIIGTQVKDVYDEIEKVLDKTTSSDEKDGSSQSPIEKLIDFISSTFSPIIPIITGAGMLRALLAILTVFGLLNTESQTTLRK